MTSRHPSNNTRRLRTLLFEIGTEELPPLSLRTLGECLHTDMLGKLREEGLIDAGVDKGRWFATPRRLAVLIPNVRINQMDKITERRGPAIKAAYDSNGHPTPAAIGFARSNQCSIEQLDVLKTAKGEWLVYRQKKPGAGSKQLLPNIVKDCLARLPIAKRMRWGDGDDEFIRPVHWVVLMLGHEVVPAKLFGIDSGNKTRGHRFHCRRSLLLRTATSYEKMLREKGFVVADYDERRQIITAQMRLLATNANATLVADDALLDEVTSLVEWPRAIIGSFDKAFLATPEEAVISSMRDHQKYFHLNDTRSRLLPRFITVSNIESKTPVRVREGNERVLQARLADARFFWQSDCKTSLEARRHKLKGVLFHIKLGSLFDKSERLVYVADKIASHLQHPVTDCQRAATLCKTDLVTEMVGEFPGLQGTMGRYYAVNDSENTTVAEAIGEHYQPRFAGDTLPNSITGQVIALADKMDSLTGLFLAGEEPSGDKDRFALRRATLGCIRIIIEKRLDLDFQQLVNWCWQAYAEQDALALQIGENSNDISDKLMHFTLDRLQQYYAGQKEIPVAAFLAVRAVQPVNLLEFHQRLLAVTNFGSRAEAAALCAANKRIHNILKKTRPSKDVVFDSTLLKESAEKELAAAVARCTDEISTMLDKRAFDAALTLLAGLKEPIDRFFDDVMVMVDDIQQRNNRLLLLLQTRQLFLRIADVSRLNYPVNPH